MPIDSAGPTGNLLLDALSDLDRALIASHLEAVTYARGQTVFEAGEQVAHVTFPCHNAVLALVVTTRDGRIAETATIGHDGVAGGIVAQGRVPAFVKGMVQIGGPMLRLEAERLEEAASQSASLRDLLTRYTDCFVAQLLQTAACNALHPIEQRCLRWFLTLQDRIGGDTLPITHELLAAMLGVQRTYLTRILRLLQDQGLIRVARGRITILDRPAVSAAACECHARVRLHCEAVLEPVYAPERRDREPVSRTRAG
ncbi:MULTISPECIES: Crp/Fnr family transcriptional regulator [unclassified Methylobacterium]|jgi:CRP-like cAMP-binding protein|uniref:Crp/Fnr family transcriptional regulator n=1 Tax=unclassified Methylobacterium TaxID=2615210 RepID=UPI00135429DE|nr:Crp/Fnr family transcriptional regulator [Methylobacterium sp. 2A]MWV25641.1 Crp/Fnr family transcriptional regulator [Methylobacterium sp. 2A]